MPQGSGMFDVGQMPWPRPGLMPAAFGPGSAQPREYSEYEKRYQGVRLAVSHTQDMDHVALAARIAVVFKALGLEQP